MKTAKGSTPNSVDEYLASLPEDRRTALAKVRQVVRDNLSEGFEEGMQYGMIGYYVPHSIFPSGYHAKPSEPLPFAHIGSQKNHMAVYLMGLSGDPKRENDFRQRWAKTGKKLDMGKSCIRFKALEDLALDVLAHTIRDISVKQYVAQYRTNLGKKAKPSTSSTPSDGKKTAKKAGKRASTSRSHNSKAPISETRPIVRAKRTPPKKANASQAKTTRKV